MLYSFAILRYDAQHMVDSILKTILFDLKHMPPASLSQLVFGLHLLRHRFDFMLGSIKLAQRSPARQIVCQINSSGVCIVILLVSFAEFSTMAKLCKQFYQGVATHLADEQKMYSVPNYTPATRQAIELVHS